MYKLLTHRARRVAGALLCLTALSTMLAGCSLTSLPPSDTGSSMPVPLGPKRDPAPVSLPPVILAHTNYDRLLLPLLPPPPPCDPFCPGQRLPVVMRALPYGDWA
jgi:hypothetical protein